MLQNQCKLFAHPLNFIPHTNGQPLWDLHRIANTQLYLNSWVYSTVSYWIVLFVNNSMDRQSVQEDMPNASFLVIFASSHNITEVVTTLKPLWDVIKEQTSVRPLCFEPHVPSSQLLRPFYTPNVRPDRYQRSWLSCLILRPTPKPCNGKRPSEVAFHQRRLKTTPCMVNHSV